MNEWRSSPLFATSWPLRPDLRMAVAARVSAPPHHAMGAPSKITPLTFLFVVQRRSPSGSSRAWSPWIPAGAGRGRSRSTSSIRTGYKEQPAAAPSRQSPLGRYNASSPSCRSVAIPLPALAWPQTAVSLVCCFCPTGILDGSGLDHERRPLPKELRSPAGKQQTERGVEQDEEMVLAESTAVNRPGFVRKRSPPARSPPIASDGHLRRPEEDHRQIAEHLPEGSPSTPKMLTSAV